MSGLARRHRSAEGDAHQAQSRGAEPAPHPATTLRVLAVSPELRFAGGESQLLGLTRELIHGGHRAEVACDPRAELWRRASAAGVRCYPLAIRNSLDLRAGLRLRSFLKRERFDVVHFHTARAHALAPFAARLGPRLVVTRRMDYRPNRLFAPWLYGRVVDGVAAISQAVVEALVAARVPRDAITLVPSGVDCAFFAPPSEPTRARARVALGLTQEEVALGTVGALEPRKGHRFLIEAAARLGCGDESGRARARFFFAGDGALRSELIALAARLGVAQKISFLGQTGDVRELLHGLDIFVLPSLHEGLGVAALEAMACGLPVVAAAAGGLCEAVEEGQNGFLVEPGSAGALAARLSELIGAPAERARMGKESRKLAEQRFSLTSMASRTLELYWRCLEGNQRRTPRRRATICEV